MMWRNMSQHLPPRQITHQVAGRRIGFLGDNISAPEILDWVKNGLKTGLGGEARSPTAGELGQWETYGTGHVNRRARKVIPEKK